MANNLWQYDMPRVFEYAKKNTEGLDILQNQTLIPFAKKSTNLWNTKILISTGIGRSPFEAPQVVPNLSNTLGNLPAPGTHLWANEICMVGDMFNEANVVSQLPPGWVFSTPQKCVLSWNTMRSNKYIHFVTIWTSYPTNPRVRWKHLVGMALPRTYDMNACPNIAVDDSSNDGGGGTLLRKNGRIIGQVVRKVVVVPKYMKQCENDRQIQRYCASQILGASKHHKEEIRVNNYDIYVKATYISGSSHMQDCAYDVVVGYQIKKSKFIKKIFVNTQ